MKDHVKIFAKKLEGVEKTLLPNGTWRVHGNLDLSNCDLDNLNGLNVSIVDGDFNVSNNQLTSMVGTPPNVYGEVICFNNLLTTLKGLPNTVYGLACFCNYLEDFDGCPENIFGHFTCTHNYIKTLKGICKYVGGHLRCHHNAVDLKEADIRAVCKVRDFVYTTVSGKE